MDYKKNEYVVIKCDDDIQIRLPLEKFKEFDENGHILIFDFHTKSMFFAPYNAFLDDRG